MKKISKLLKQPKVKPKTKRKETWYGDFGKEMTEYFGQNCFWLPHKYPQWKLRAKFKEIKKLENKKLQRSFAYFMGMLNGA